MKRGAIPDVVTREWAERLGLEFNAYKRAPAFVHRAIEFVVLLAEHRAPDLTAAGRKPVKQKEQKNV
jgi:hypothetical protein